MRPDGAIFMNKNKADRLVSRIIAMRPDMEKLTDAELAAKTDEFKGRLSKGESLASILPEAYAVVREASRRTTGLEQFPVQILSGIYLNAGYIAEQATGEGKTLAAAMPSYLNALSGKGVHVVTVNDYLANRDAEDIGRIHRFLGLTVGCIVNTSSTEKRREAYDCDITYVTNTELGFDYLRDNMTRRMEDRVQRGFHFCIIDEVDSVLIDEARTPLIISGGSGKPTQIYVAADALAKSMERGEASGEIDKISSLLGQEITETGDFIVDEKDQIITLTAQGVEKAEKYFGIENISDAKNNELYHNIILALRANYLMRKDKDYIVKDGEVLIVDEFTGRVMPGRRYSDGLHQAIEAKEGVQIKQENYTFATITYQNLFNKYDKKCGMTGTAYTERKEFKDIYHMNVARIPTNKPCIRKDYQDSMYATKKEKFSAVVASVKASYEKGQPVLVGTSTIKDSEIMDRLLTDAHIPHTVLNAKQDEKEAEIIAKAGRYKAITIATNMAGRGTDIKLDDKAKAAGGLKVIGTTRHDSRRIDNQLRGRSGRQGDPGESKFYLSLEDDLMRLFGSERLISTFRLLGVKEGEEICHPAMSRFIRKAQKKVEYNHFAMRKRVLDYDNVNDKQREIIYSQRNDAQTISDADMENTILHMISYISDGVKNSRRSKEDKEKYVSLMFHGAVKDIDKVAQEAKAVYEAAKCEAVNPDAFLSQERNILLATIDMRWMEHLNNLEILRQNISLVGYGQKDPVVLYKSKAFDMFQDMLRVIKEDVVYTLFQYIFAGKAARAKEAPAA